MHPLRYLLEPGAILMVVVSLGFLANGIVRGLGIPRCFLCGAVKVRPSPPAGFLDLAGSALMIRPYRCLGCRARFHAVDLFHRSSP
jgi:hypothetical protein